MVDRSLDGARLVCIREIQLSLADSVHQLLVDKINQLGLSRYFNITDRYIGGPNDSHIIFRGMQSFNADTIKSLEGYDGAWVEEAQMLSQRSLDLLYPTIRKPNSELMFSWNPRFRTDPVDVLFRKQKRDDAIAVNVNWNANPWFPDVLRREMEADYKNDPERAEHIWGGGYEVGQGAILARWIERAEREGRITDDVAYDPDGMGIEVSSDIGFRDTATWWFWQRRIGGADVLDHDKDSGLEASDWIDRLKAKFTERGWKLGKIHLPHDARNKTFNSKHSAVEQFVRAFGSDHVDIVPVSKTPDRINAARTFVKRCRFHATNCAEGLDALRAWEFEWNADTMTFSREPLHNWASHDGDGFSYGCQVMQGLVPPPPPPKPEAMHSNWTVNDIVKLTQPDRKWA